MSRSFVVELGDHNLFLAKPGQGEQHGAPHATTYMENAEVYDMWDQTVTNRLREIAAARDWFWMERARPHVLYQGEIYQDTLDRYYRQGRWTP